MCSCAGAVESVHRVRSDLLGLDFTEIFCYLREVDHSPVLKSVIFHVPFEMWAPELHKLIPRLPGRSRQCQEGVEMKFCPHRSRWIPLVRVTQLSPRRN